MVDPHAIRRESQFQTALWQQHDNSAWKYQTNDNSTLRLFGALSVHPKS
jgi:hypothetical protein